MKIFLILAIILPQALYAYQDSSLNSHAIGMEALGKSVVWIDLFYEYSFNQKFSAGASLGFSEYNQLHTRPEASLLTTASLFGAYRFHWRKKNIHSNRYTLFKSGVIFLQEYHFRTDVLSLQDLETEPIGFISLGVEFNPNHYFFRIEPHLLFGGDFYITESFLPWLGLSAGKRF